MAQQLKVGAHKTRIYTDSAGYVCVVYHSTAVVRFNNDYIILDTGGYFSNTTKLRMNQASNQYHLGYKVYQSKHEWYVDYCGNTYHFDKNRMILINDGTRLVGDIPRQVDIYNSGTTYPNNQTAHARMDGNNQEYKDYMTGMDEEEAW